MSKTTVYLAHADRVERIAELSNSWGAGAFVCSILSEKYLGDRHIWLWDPIKQQELWDLANDSRLYICERIVLACTFDRAIIESDKFYDAAWHWADFESMHYKDKGVCHVGTISRLLLQHHKEKTPCIGMCFQQTSVAESQWERWDEEKDEPIPFSLETYKHFFVFKEFGGDK